jgi:hypothetical protein
MTAHRRDVNDTVRSVSDLYAASELREHDNYREEGVSHENLADVLSHSSFSSQDLFVELVDEHRKVQDQGLFLDEGGTEPANHLDQVIEYNAAPTYNVVFGETHEGLALHARTLSTYRTNPKHLGEQPEAYYIGVVNVPSAEDYGNVGTEDLADIRVGTVKELLDGGDPTLSIQETMHRVLDSARDVAHRFRR